MQNETTRKRYNGSWWLSLHGNLTVTVTVMVTVTITVMEDLFEPH